MYKRAVIAWRRDRPHEALDILDQAGMANHWPSFQRAMFADARERFHAAMGPYLPQ